MSAPAYSMDAEYRILREFEEVAETEMDLEVLRYFDRLHLARAVQDAMAGRTVPHEDVMRLFQEASLRTHRRSG